MISQTSTLTKVAGVSGVSRSRRKAASATRTFSPVSKSHKEC